MNTRASAVSSSSMWPTPCNSNLYVHHFSGQRNTFKRQGWVWCFRTAICTGEAFHIKCDLSACAGNLLIFLFGCAAYGLLFKQTRALRSNSVFKAIAMLAKPAKICQRSARTSGEICTLIVESLPCANGCSEAPSQTLPFESVPLTRKVVHIRFEKQEIVKEIVYVKTQASSRTPAFLHSLFTF